LANGKIPLIIAKAMEANGAMEDKEQRSDREIENIHMYI
jgi:hypothetical protein